MFKYNRDYKIQKIISILFLSILLFQMMGYLLIFKIQQFYIREEIEQRIKVGLPENELVLLKVPANLSGGQVKIFQWFHKREFCYKAKMYDIVRKENHDNTIWYYCLSDEKETELLADLDNLVKQEIDKNTWWKQYKIKLLKLLNSQFFRSQNIAALILPEQELHLINYLFSLKTWISLPAIPPPKI